MKILSFIFLSNAARLNKRMPTKYTTRLYTMYTIFECFEIPRRNELLLRSKFALYDT